MSDVGSFIIGTVATAAGVALSFAPIPGARALSAALISFGITKMMQGVKGRPSQEGIQANVGAPRATLPVVYGTAKIGMKIHLTRVDDNSRKDLYRGGTLCVGSQDGSGINGVNKVWLDDELAINGPAVADLEDSNQNLHETNVTSFFSGNFYYGLQLGTDSETVDNRLNRLFPNAWPSSSSPDRGAVLNCLLKKDKEIFPRLPNVTAEVEGNKCYDPRDGTWKFTSNPALHLLDYLTSDFYGAGFNYPERDSDGTVTEIDEQSFIDAANYADESVQDGSGGTQPRFRFDGWLDTGNGLMQNIGILLNAMRGELVQQGGVFRLVIRQAQSAVSGFELHDTKDGGNVLGETQVTVKGSSSVPNAVVVSYVDENEGDTSAEVRWPEPGQTNNFLSNDNDKRHEVALAVQGVQNRVRAQQIGMVALKEARADAVVELTATEEALQLEVGDVVQYTNESAGWSQKKFWVVGMGLRPDWTVDLALREYDANAYSLDPQNQKDAPPGSNLPDPFAIADPLNVTCLSDSTTVLDLPGGDRVPRIKVTWDLPDSEYIDRAEVFARKVGSSTWDEKVATRDVGDEQVAFAEVGKEGEDWESGVQLVNTREHRSNIVTCSSTLRTGHQPDKPCPNLLPVGVDTKKERSSGSGSGRKIYHTFPRIHVERAGLTPGDDSVAFGFHGKRSLVQTTVDSDGLVAEYKPEDWGEADGAEIADWPDATANGHDMSTTDGPTKNANQLNGFARADFNGSSEFFENTSINCSLAGTFSSDDYQAVAFVLDGYTTGGTDNPIVVQGSQESDGNGGFEIAEHDNGTSLRLRWGGGSGQQIKVSTTMDDGNPHIYVVSWTGSTVYTIRDGSTIDSTGNIEGAPGCDTNNSEMEIGRSTDTTVGVDFQWWPHNIVHVALWGKGKSETESQTISDQLNSRYSVY